MNGASGWLADLDQIPASWWQTSLRALVVFGCGLLLVRIAGKRAFGKWAALDIVLAVIIGSNLSRTITGGAPFWPTIFATLAIVGLHAALSFGAVMWPDLGDWVKGRPARLIQNGKIDHRQLKRHGIGIRDLQQALRLAGSTDPHDVASAHLERNGEISVVAAPRRQAVFDAVANDPFAHSALTGRTAKWAINLSVWDRKGALLGRVDNLEVDPNTGQATKALVRSVLPKWRGAPRRAIVWERLRYDDRRRAFVTDFDESAFLQIPVESRWGRGLGL